MLFFYFQIRAPAEPEHPEEDQADTDSENIDSKWFYKNRGDQLDEAVIGCKEQIGAENGDMCFGGSFQKSKN